MNCQPEQIEAYQDGELSPREKLELEEHLAGCAACREELDRTRNLDLLLRKIPEGEISDRERYLKEVRSLVRRRRGLSWMGVAALFLLGLTVWNVYEAIKPDEDPPREPLSIRSELLRFSSLEEETSRKEILDRFQAEGEPGIRALIAALEDEDVRVQIAATQVLSKIRDERVRELLLKVADRPEETGGEDGEEWDLEDPAITACFYRAMEVAERDSDPGNLFSLLEEAGGEDPEIMDALSEWVENLLQSGRVSRQRLSIRILGHVGLELPWWNLLPLLASPELGGMVLDLLRSRTGKDFGSDPEPWRRHFQEL